MPIDPNEFDRKNLSSSLEPEPKGAASCPEQRPLSEIARLMYALIAPAKTFSDLRRKPSWWVPLGLIGSASLAYVLASLSRLSLKPDVVDPRIGALYSSPLVGRLPFFPGIDVSPHLLYMAPLVYPLFYLLLALTCFGVLKLSGVADTTYNSTLLCGSIISFCLLNVVATDLHRPERRVSSSKLATDEIAVYNAFLALVANPQSTINLSVRTFPLDLSFPFKSNGCVNDLILDIPKESKRVHVFTSRIFPRQNLRFVDPEKQQQIIEQNDPMVTIQEGKTVDRAVKDAFSNGLFSVSEIAFDKEHKHAVMQYRFDCGALCGNGATVVFENNGGEWRKARICGKWVS